MQKEFKKNTGFTLVELMVSVSIFSMVVLVAFGAVLSIVAANKKAQALNSVINNLNFAFEGMVRDLRTGYDYQCDLGGSPDTGCLNGIYFSSTQSTRKNGADTKVTYRHNSSNNQIEKRESGGVTVDYVPITASDVHIESLKFFILDQTPASSGNYSQPRILVVLRGYTGSAPGSKDYTEFNLQTFVSQRMLDL